MTLELLDKAFRLLNNKAACPYCYERVSLRGLWYRCTGRPAPGKAPCKKIVDQARVNVLSDHEAQYPSFQPETPRGLLSSSPFCPHCQGPSGFRVCPNCHSSLPAEFSANSPLIGIVGARGSGKTVLLTVLGRELKALARRFGDASIAASGSTKLLTRLARERDEMESCSSLPAQTPRKTAEETVPAVYALRLTKPIVASFTRQVASTFSFYDTAGEDLTTADCAQDQHYLAAADGLILLLDPFGFPANKDNALKRGVALASLRDDPLAVLRALTESLQGAEHLKGAQKIRKPVAVVLAKIDAFFDEVDPNNPIRSPSSNEPLFDEKESLDLHEHVASLIDKWGGDDVLRLLASNYKTYRFFVASALGAEPDYRKARVSNHGVHPHRVAEPLLWHLARRGLVKTKTKP